MKKDQAKNPKAPKTAKAAKALTKRAPKIPEFLRKHFGLTNAEAKENSASRALATALLVSMAMNLGFLGNLTALLPLKEKYPVLVAYGDSINKIIYMRPLPPENTQLEFIIEAQLAAVVKERYEVVRDVDFMRWRLLGDRHNSLWRAHVTNSVHNTHLPQIRNTIKHLEEVSLFRREIEIVTVNRNPKIAGSYIVQYLVFDSIYGRSPDSTEAVRSSLWETLIRVQPLPREQYTNLNPAGVQIYSFSPSRIQ